MNTDFQTKSCVCTLQKWLSSDLDHSLSPIRYQAIVDTIELQLVLSAVEGVVC